jgi:hypothetical protein
VGASDGFEKIIDQALRRLNPSVLRWSWYTNGRGVTRRDQEIGTFEGMDINCLSLWYLLATTHVTQLESFAVTKPMWQEGDGEKQDHACRTVKKLNHRVAAEPNAGVQM